MNRPKKNYSLTALERKEVYEKGELIKGDVSYIKKPLGDDLFLIEVFEKGKKLPVSFGVEIAKLDENISGEEKLSERLTIAISPSFRRKIDDYCAAKDIAINDFVRGCIEEKIFG